MSASARPVSGWRDRREFVELPFRLHSTSAVWVPPLRLERLIFLLRSQNAFFSHGDAQLFLAWRDGRVVGRISAQYDDNYNAYHSNRDGMSDFPEFADAPDLLPRVRGRPRSPAPGARGRRGRAAGPGPRPDDRPDGLHDERRVRRDDRGLRA